MSVTIRSFLRSFLGSTLSSSLRPSLGSPLRSALRACKSFSRASFVRLTRSSDLPLILSLPIVDAPEPRCSKLASFSFLFAFQFLFSFPLSLPFPSSSIGFLAFSCARPLITLAACKLRSSLVDWTVDRCSSSLKFVAIALRTSHWHSGTCSERSIGWSVLLASSVLEYVLAFVLESVLTLVLSSIVPSVLRSRSLLLVDSFDLLMSLVARLSVVLALTGHRSRQLSFDDLTRSLGSCPASRREALREARWSDILRLPFNRFTDGHTVERSNRLLCISLEVVESFTVGLFTVWSFTDETFIDGLLIIGLFTVGPLAGGMLIDRPALRRSSHSSRSHSGVFASSPAAMLCLMNRLFRVASFVSKPFRRAVEDISYSVHRRWVTRDAQCAFTKERKWQIFF